jgi:hypothetical protein
MESEEETEDAEGEDSRERDMKKGNRRQDW